MLFEPPAESKPIAIIEKVCVLPTNGRKGQIILQQERMLIWLLAQDNSPCLERPSPRQMNLPSFASAKGWFSIGQSGEALARAHSSYSEERLLEEVVSEFLGG